MRAFLTKLAYRWLTHVTTASPSASYCTPGLAPELTATLARIADSTFPETAPLTSAEAAAILNDVDLADRISRMRFDDLMREQQRRCELEDALEVALAQRDAGEARITGDEYAPLDSPVVYRWRGDVLEFRERANSIWFPAIGVSASDVLPLAQLRGAR